MRKCTMAGRLGGMFAAGLGLLASQAGAVMLTDWNATNVIAVGDQTNDQPVASRNIVGLRYRKDGGVHYFRLDLAAPPQQVAGKFSPEYSIQIDDIPGGGTSPDTAYFANVPSGLQFDQIVDAHYTLETAWTAFHRHNYLGNTSAPPQVDTTNLFFVGGNFDQAEDAGGGPGSMLQWSIPSSSLFTTSFLFYAVTMSINSGVTYDWTHPLSTENIPIIITNIAALATNRVQVDWLSLGGRRYRIQYASDLGTDTFHDISRTAAEETETNVPTGFLGNMSFTDDFSPPQGVPLQDRRFYRVHTVVP
jgi:hypothetical protein